MSDKTKLTLHTNPAPISPMALDARINQCITELRPAFDRVLKRYEVHVFLGALVSECQEASIAAAGARRIPPDVAALILKRLQTSVERARDANDAVGLEP